MAMDTQENAKQQEAENIQAENFKEEEVNEISEAVSSSSNTASRQVDNRSIEERAAEFGVDFLKRAPTSIDQQVLHFISEEAARRYEMVSFAHEGNVINVAMIHPQNVEALNVLRFLTQKDGVDAHVYLVDKPVFDEILGQYNATEKVLNDAILSFDDKSGTGFSEEDMEREGDVGKNESREILQDAPIAKLVHVIIKHAMDGRASDIHIEPIENNYRVRFRVDGVLHSSLVIPPDVGRAVVSRIKILSNLKIDEKRKPQDGRFRFTEGIQVIDLRVSTFPVIEGEKVVMRLLDKSKGLADLSTLGLMGRNYEVMMENIREPFGIILMTGPTGSGKSTSLYAFLKILNQEERNIVTLEDPVEYFLEGINQSQVKPEIGYTFANGLRSILRQDPNVIMVGEIRDSETAELAIHAALTGHLVFSTLHTNDALGAIPRLVDMGIEPFLLASSLQVVAAQRLVRRICGNCREEVQLSDAVLRGVKRAVEKVSPEEGKKYGVDLQQKISLYHGKGCDECNRSGYKGRVAVHEVFEVTPQSQIIISSKNNIESNLEKEAVNQGMMSMKQDGLLKALAGLTTLEEIERVTDGSIMVDEE